VASKGFWAGWIAFAGMLLMIIGGLDFFQGLVAVIRDQYYVQGKNGALVIDVSQWGWIMMIWGAILAFVGYGLLSGASWARWVAIVGVSLNFLAVLGFDGGSAYTLWSLVLIALNILVLWALIVRWGDVKEAMVQ
jgi:hypothetical protein